MENGFHGQLKGIFKNFSTKVWNTPFGYLLLGHLKSLRTMLKTFLFTLSFIALNGFAIEIPKKLLGEYYAEVSSYDFEHNDRDLKASSHIIRIILKEDAVWYQSGKLTLEGDYKEVKTEGQNVLFDINVSNSKSINFDFNLNVNKKTGEAFLSGLKGVPDTKMRKRPSKPEKNRGFRRL
jgi:hypothetical protein